MLWIPLSLACAFSLATTDALTKKVIPQYDVYLLAWVRNIFAAPIFIIALFLVKTPHLDIYFVLAVLTGLPLEILSVVLYLKSIKLSPLSVTTPFLALTPAFLIITSYIMLGESPDLSGFAGILLITLGAYLLNLSSFKDGILAPLKAVLRERGSVLMIFVAFIYSITSNICKIGMNHSSPVFFASSYYLLLTILLTVFAKKKITNYSWFKTGSLAGIKSFSLIGFFYGLMVITHFTSMSLTNVAYMISVKRTSLIFSVLYGKLMFGEEKIRERLLGSVVMLIGVALITLF